MKKFILGLLLFSQVTYAAPSVAAPKTPPLVSAYLVGCAVGMLATLKATNVKRTSQIEEKVRKDCIKMFNRAFPQTKPLKLPFGNRT